MTDATNTAAAEPIVLELLGPGPNYANKTVWLPQLFRETARAGSMVIEGRRFENCLIEGPAVLLPLEGCNFDGCNMGVKSLTRYQNQYPAASGHARALAGQLIDAEEQLSNELRRYL